LYSFKYRKIMRMDVKAVARHLYPFRDPTCVVNRQSFTWDQIHHLQNLSPEDFGPEEGAPSTRASAKAQSPAIEGEKAARNEQSRAGNQAEQQEGDQRGNEPEIRSESDLRVAKTHCTSVFLNYGDSITRSALSIRQSILTQSLKQG